MPWEALVSMVQMEPVNTNSAISIGLMITVIGAAVFLTRSLTRIEQQLLAFNEKMKELGKLPDRVRLMEKHMSHLENDLNNLWEAYRKEEGDSRDNTRGERGLPRKRLRPRGEDQDREDLDS